MKLIDWQQFSSLFILLRNDWKRIGNLIDRQTGGGLIRSIRGMAKFQRGPLLGNIGRRGEGMGRREEEKKTKIKGKIEGDH